MFIPYTSFSMYGGYVCSYMVHAAEREFRVPRLVLTGVLLDVLESDLFIVVIPRVRQNGIRGNVTDQVLGQAQAPAVLYL